MELGRREQLGGPGWAFKGGTTTPSGDNAHDGGTAHHNELGLFRLQNVVTFVTVTLITNQSLQLNLFREVP